MESEHYSFSNCFLDWNSLGGSNFNFHFPVSKALVVSAAATELPLASEDESSALHLLQRKAGGTTSNNCAKDFKCSACFGV